NLESQRLDKKKQEVKNVVEQPTKRGTRITKSLQNFRVKKSSISLNNSSQISSVHAITPVLPTEEPEYSLSMGYEHLSTISKAESDEVIKSSANNLLPILSEYEVTSDDESECDVPVKDKSSPIFTTFSNLIFDCNDDFTSSDDESLSDEDVSMEDFKDGDSQREEIDIFTGTNDLLPPGIESDDYDLEGDIHFLGELLVDDSISILENESSDFDHHDDPSFPRPPPEPPDVEFFFNLKPDSGEVISAVMNNIEELNKDKYFDLGGEINVFENVEDDDYFPFIFVI
nr:hypothetical protein [Tanacetum cinerariifolium]